jgi:hypothetical protein
LDCEQVSDLSCLLAGSLFIAKLPLISGLWQKLVLTQEETSALAD